MLGWPRGRPRANPRNVSTSLPIQLQYHLRGPIFRPAEAPDDRLLNEALLVTQMSADRQAAQQIARQIQAVGAVPHAQVWPGHEEQFDKAMQWALTGSSTAE